MRHNNTHTIIILDREDRRKWTVLSTGTVNEIKTVKFEMKLITVFRITYNAVSWSRTHYEIKLYLSYDPAVLSRFHSHSALIINVEGGHILRGYSVYVEFRINAPYLYYSSFKTH
jgi:hypothetical protein